MSNHFIHIKNQQRIRIILITVAALIPLLIAGLGRSFFSMNDDGAVLSLLQSGDARTFIISYPMSYLLVSLYKQNALIPWYSLFVLAMLSIATATMTYAILSNKYADLVQKTLLLSFVLYFGLFSSNDINYTNVVTLLFVSVHMLALSSDSVVSKLMIVLLVPLVLLTRCGDVIVILLAFSALPLIIVAKSRNSFAVRILCFVIIIMAAFAINKYPHDSDYESYKKFNSVRSAYNDLDYPMNIVGVDADDESTFKYWFSYDEKVFPTKLLIDNAPSSKSLLTFVFRNTGLKQITKLVFRHVLDFMLIAVSLIYVMRTKVFSNRAIIAIVSQIVMCIVLFRIRDVDRLSVGILFLILSSIHLMPRVVEGATKPIERLSFKKSANFNCDSYDVTLLSLKPYLLVLIILMLFIQIKKFSGAIDHWLDRGSILRPKEIQLIKENMLKTRELNGVLLVPDMLTASSMYYTFPLGKEKSMLGYSAEGWIPSGWLSRSPLYYKIIRTNGSESFSDKLRHGQIALVYFNKFDNKLSHELYNNFMNKHYASIGCRFVPNILYRDKYISVETFQIDCR